MRGGGVRVGDGIYRCDICGRVPREEVYIRRLGKRNECRRSI